MATLLEDIELRSEWIAEILNEEGYCLDYSILSLLDIDRFLFKYIQNGKPIAGSEVAKNIGIVMFSLSSYIGETLIRNIPNSRWSFDNNNMKLNETDITVLLNEEVTIFPGQRILKRMYNGLDDGIYPYGLTLAKNYTNEIFDNKFWDIANEIKPYIKAWWKFW